MGDGLRERLVAGAASKIQVNRAAVDPRHGMSLGLLSEVRPDVRDRMLRELLP